METSNIIALGALIVSFVALIPTYYQVFYQGKKKKEKNNSLLKSTEQTTNTQRPKQEDNKVEYNVLTPLLVWFKSIVNF